MKLAFIIFLTSAVAVLAQLPILPDPKLSPGAMMAGVTVQQICQKGYANKLNGGVRHVPESEKRQVFIEYFGSVPSDTGDYEVDHLISLELGGSNDIKNLWPQPYKSLPWNAHVKDKLEDFMAAQVRKTLQNYGPDVASQLLKKFQFEIANNWTNAYQKYLGNP